MSAPIGLGWWVAFERAIAPGGKKEDLRIAVERCVATGSKWVALRMGLDGANDPEEGAAHGAESIAAFRAAGIDVYSWVYVKHHGALPRVIAGAKAMLAGGVQGIIIDAEFDYDGGEEDANALVLALRGAGADWVGHAPPDYLGAGLIGPVPGYLKALDAACDAIMPQVYAWEHNDRGHVYHLTQVCAGYQKRGYGPDKVCPIAASYRPKVRGGKPVPFMPSEAAQVAGDLIAFLTHPAVASCPAPSLYSLDAVSWINGSSDRVIATLSERANRDTLPAPPPANDDEPITSPGISQAALERRRSSQSIRAVNAPIIDADDGTAVTPLRAGPGELEYDPEPPEAA